MGVGHGRAKGPVAKFGFRSITARSTFVTDCKIASKKLPDENNESGEKINLGLW